MWEGARGRVVRGRGKAEFCRVPGAHLRLSWPPTPVFHGAGELPLQVSVSAPMLALALCSQVMEGGAVLCLQGWVPAGWASDIQPITVGHSAVRHEVHRASGREVGLGASALSVCHAGLSSQSLASGVLEHRQGAGGPLRPELGEASGRSPLALVLFGINLAWPHGVFLRVLLDLPVEATLGFSLRSS